MNILCVIDHFGSGGAQRQMVSLALGLMAKGHEVEFFNYHPQHIFFRHELERVGIKIHDCPKRQKGFSWNVFKTLRSVVKTKKYDVALAYLDTPSIYLLLAALGTKTKVVVSDRSSYMGFNKYNYAIKKQIFHVADAIVVNSHTQANWLVHRAKLSSKKTLTIYNGYHVEKFHFCPLFPVININLKLIAIGRINYVKNFENLINALDIFHSKHGWCPSLTWVGRSDSPQYEKKIYKMLDQFPHVKAIWTWAGQRTDIPSLLANHHALILPSLYEGLPNVVCEAMLSGKPILISNVCDHPILVKDGKRGFLFDPKEPEDIAQAIKKLSALQEKDWEYFSQNVHDYAKSKLSLQSMVSEYEKLFADLVMA